MWPKKFEFETFLKIDRNYCVDLLFNSLNHQDYLKNFEILISKYANVGNLNERSRELITTMFDKVTNLNLCKIFLTKFSQSLAVGQLVKLIIKYGWNELKESITQSLIPIDRNKLNKNCKLVTVNIFF